jgi:hypothetical protein
MSNYEKISQKSTTLHFHVSPESLRRKKKKTATQEKKQKILPGSLRNKTFIHPHVVFLSTLQK